MRARNSAWRRAKSSIMIALSVLCVVVALVPLFAILWTTLLTGLPALFNPAFYTWNLPPPCVSPDLPGCFGGALGAIVGTLVLVAIATAISVPIGILAGIYLSEYGSSRGSGALRFFVEVMLGVPSIVVGIFIYTLVILLAENGWIPSAWAVSTLAGALALSVIMIPLIARTADEALGLVPNSTREAALALGIPRHRTITRIVLSSAGAAVLTGALLGVARAAGETAPLIVTTAGNLFGFQSLKEPTAALPTTIYNYGFSGGGYANYLAIGWGSALLLIGMMLLISVTARYFFSRSARRLGGRMT